MPAGFGRRLLAAGAASATLAGCSPLRLLDATVPTGDVVATTGLAYGEGPRRRLDIYRPLASPRGAASPRPLVVFLYGGNWRTGDRADYRFVATALAARGIVVVVPDYRLFPEAAFPGFVEDAAAAVAFAAARATEFGADPRAVFVAGHSAGAHIALLLALDPGYLARAGYDRTRLAGAIGLAGPYDFDPAAYPDTRPVFAPAADPRLTQPITFADLAGQPGAPPLLLLHGTADRTVLPRNTTALAARVRAAGGRAETALYPDLGHAGILLALTPWFAGRAPVLEDMLRFVAAEAARAGVSTATAPT